MKSKALPSLTELQQVFDYSPVTGDLRRNGVIVGGIDAYGYRVLSHNYKKYKAHRIIWKLMTGEDPGELMVDHINRDTLNNAWHNLRLADEFVNSRNSSKRVGTTYFRKGVYETSCSGAYLGRFKDKAMADLACKMYRRTLK